MGLFGKKVKSDAEIFLGLEKNAQKYPAHLGAEVIGVYLCGNWLPRGNQTIVHLPQFIAPEKAPPMARAALDRENIRRGEKYYGRGPELGTENVMKNILAFLSPDEAEKEKYIREACFKREYTPVCWYVYTRGLMDKYCRFLEERLLIYKRIGTPSPDLNYKLSPEADPGRDHGIDSWIWHEIYGCIPEEERVERGRAELRALRTSDDPEIKERTNRFLEARDRAAIQSILDLMESQVAAMKYASGELGMKVVDKQGNEIKMK